MARRVKRLSARFVETVGNPGRYADGDGLYLIVSPKGAKNWQFLFRWQGKLKEMGLGSQSGLGLLEAREIASGARKVLATGRNPIEVRRAFLTTPPPALLCLAVDHKPRGVRGAMA